MKAAWWKRSCDCSAFVKKHPILQMRKLRLGVAHLDWQAPGFPAQPPGALGEPLSQAGLTPESTLLPVQATPTLGFVSPPWMGGRLCIYGKT